MKTRMQNRDSNKWLWPPADQWITVWGMLALSSFVFLASQLASLFSHLTGFEYICCYSIGLAVTALGLCLIFHAKLPLYRERRFFTFGSRAVPESRRSFYRWGYLCVIFASVFLLCLLLSVA